MGPMDAILESLITVHQRRGLAERAVHGAKAAPNPLLQNSTEVDMSALVNMSGIDERSMTLKPLWATIVVMQLLLETQLATAKPENEALREHLNTRNRSSTSRRSSSRRSQ
jgi:hypothetical protein